MEDTIQGVRLDLKAGDLRNQISTAAENRLRNLWEDMVIEEVLEVLHQQMDMDLVMELTDMEGLLKAHLGVILIEVDMGILMVLLLHPVVDLVVSDHTIQRIRHYLREVFPEVDRGVTFLQVQVAGASFKETTMRTQI